MTVKIYVAKDSENKVRPPDTPHEVQGVLYLLTEFWRKYHHLPGFYGLVANMRFPSADLVIFTERGIGVLELKNYPGLVTVRPDGTWYAGKAMIKGGAGCKNPHEQVQNYGAMIREKITRAVFPEERYRWDEIKFQTAVCFMADQADLSNIKKRVDFLNRDNQPWENRFDILYPNEISEWALKIMFTIKKDGAHDYEPITIKPARLDAVIKRTFNAVEWEEMVAQMPPGKKYGCVIVHDGQDELYHPLYLDETIIGRGKEECQVAIPNKFELVSNVHCKIVRSLEGVKIIDLQSKHGTYNLEGARITEAGVSSNRAFCLGGAPGEPGACVVQIQLGETAARAQVPTR